MHQEIMQEFMEKLEPEQAEIVEKINAAIADSGAHLDCAIKWKSLTYAKDADYHHWICAIVASKKKVTLRFHFGTLMDDPDDLFSGGSGKYLRTTDFSTIEDVNSQQIARYVKHALSRLEHFKATWKSRFGES